MTELSPTQVLARHYGSLATRYPVSNAQQAVADLKANGYTIIRTAVEVGIEWAVHWDGDDGTYEPADNLADAVRALHSGGRDLGRVVCRTFACGPWEVSDVQ